MIKRLIQAEMPSFTLLPLAVFLPFIDKLIRDVPLQERRGERSRTICTCNHLNTQRNSYEVSKLEFSWSQEKTPATAMAISSL